MPKPKKKAAMDGLVTREKKVNRGEEEEGAQVKPMITGRIGATWDVNHHRVDRGGQWRGRVDGDRL